jgi:hypothetical protein
MDNPEFPPNSEASKRPVIDSKNVKRVTSSDATRKKKSLRKQFRETFVAGDAKSAGQYVVIDVILPWAKNMVVEAGSTWLEKLIFGDARRRGSTPPQSGPMGYVNYSRFSGVMGNRPAILNSAQRAMSRQARARHDFDEIVLDSRAEAEEVIERLFDLVESYESATVADLYELVGLSSTHTDHKWGWTDVRGAGVSRVRGGYLLDLPEPHPLN